MNLTFLHINKSGGSAINVALQGRHGKYNITLHGHDICLRGIPEGQKAFFVLRHPIDRFLSGFWGCYDRYRYHNFNTPNELAEKLSDDMPSVDKIMKITPHLFKRYVLGESGGENWFESIEYFKSRQNDILHICFLDNLSNDFKKLKLLTGLPESCKLPSLEYGGPANIGKIDDDRTLSEKSINALNEWYKKDIEFYNHCKRRNA